MRCAIRCLSLLAAVGLLAAGSSAFAALSDNIIINGDFESTANFKNADSPDSVPPHRFSQEYDLGMWVGHWGPPSNSGGLGGISTYDNPRTDPAGNTRETGDIGNMNRSVDPTNGGNHILEATMFRPSFAQWVAAPANHVPGPFEFSFDFYALNGHATFESRFNVFVYGMNVLPAHDSSFFNTTTAGAPSATNPADPNKLSPALGQEQFAPIDGDGALLFSYRGGEGKEGQVDLTRFPDSDPLVYLGVWHHMDTAEYDSFPDPLDANRQYPGNSETGEPYYIWQAAFRNKVIMELDQTYDYYAVVVQPVIYDETDPYWWIYSPDARITDSFTLGFDNFNLQLSVEDEVVIPDPVPADFSIDALVNTEDINPFILALTNTTAWLNYARPLLPDGLTDQQIIDYADPNGDGSINTEDIAWFICWLTTPGSCGGGGDAAIIPEPASLSLLGLGALALIRRRR